MKLIEKSRNPSDRIVFFNLSDNLSFSKFAHTCVPITHIHAHERRVHNTRKYKHTHANVTNKEVTRKGKQHFDDKGPFSLSF